MKKGGLTKSGGTKSMSQGPVLKTGGGVSGSSIPRSGHGPGGKTSATRYDTGTDSHSVDKKG